MWCEPDRDGPIEAREPVENERRTGSGDPLGGRFGLVGGLRVTAAAHRVDAEEGVHDAEPGGPRDQQDTPDEDEDNRGERLADPDPGEPQEAGVAGDAHEDEGGTEDESDVSVDAADGLFHDCVTATL